MGFKEVLCSLKELFPQINTRILKAVAIEHSKDIDAAVEFIVSDILPALGASEEMFDTSNEVEQSKRASSEGEGTMLTMDRRTMACDVDSNGNDSPSSVENVVLVDEHSSSSRGQGAAKQMSVNHWQSNFMHAEDGGSSGSASHKTEENIASHSEHHSSCVEAPCLETEENILDQVGPFSQSNASSSHNDNKVGGSSSLFPSECLASVKHIMGEGEFVDNSESRCNESSMNIKFEPESFDIASVNADNSPPLTVATRSGQIVKADMLEEFINDAKTYKKILVSTVDSILGLAKVVDDREREALEAKEKSSKAGLETLAKVADLKKTLTHAKEANHMHAGEVYGERSILATEVRELQSRLLALADEKEKSLSVIEEIHKTLDARLAIAEAEKMAAEKVKLEKEEIALRELTDQTAIMDKIVEESKRLKQESEENNKLRNFLMDRGRIVDTLQGEIGVICEDVWSLKERVGKHLSLGSLKYFGGFTLTSVSGFSNVEHEFVEHVGPPIRDVVPILISKPQDSKFIKECNIDVESVTSTGDCKGAIESVASADDCKGAIESVAPAVYRNGAIESVAPAVYRNGAIESVAPAVYRNGAIESVAPAVYRNGAIESVASANDRNGAIQSVASVDDRNGAIESVASANYRKVVKSVTSTNHSKVTSVTSKDDSEVTSVTSTDDSKVTSEDEWDLFEDVNDLHSVHTVR